jgi:hypothetical protein
MAKRVGLALLIAAAIYGVQLSIGIVLYQTGNIATGATHNDCGNLKQEIADRDYDGDLEEVPQEQLKQESITCLESHELTPEEAFKTEYLFWPIWPALICAGVFLAWPPWARILERQDLADPIEDAPRLEPGT